MPGSLCIGNARDAPRSSGSPWDRTLGFHWFSVARQGARSAPCVGTGFGGHRSNAHFAEGPSASGDCKVKPQATHAATAQQGQGPVYHIWFQNGTESEDMRWLCSRRVRLDVLMSINLLLRQVMLCTAQRVDMDAPMCLADTLSSAIVHLHCAEQRADTPRSAQPRTAAYCRSKGLHVLPASCRPSVQAVAHQRVASVWSGRTAKGHCWTCKQCPRLKVK